MQGGKYEFSMCKKRHVEGQKLNPPKYTDDPKFSLLYKPKRAGSPTFAQFFKSV